MDKKDKNINYMAWNSPGSNNSGSGNNSDKDKQNNDNPWNRAPSDDPWGRKKKNQSAFDADALFNLLKKLFGNNSKSQGTNNSKKNKFFALQLIAIVVVVGYVFSGFYTVREAERGVVLRFGKVHEVVEPGLRWKFPLIDDVKVVDIEQVRSIQSSGSMLTEDENLVNVEMDVQYRISDPVKYLYSVTDPDNSLLEATDSALRYVVGHTIMDDILTSGREKVRQNTKDLLVSIIDPYKLGLSVVDVNFLPARAPEQVKASFDDAIAAQEDEQRFKREAEAYANEVIPKAEGQVQRITQEAQAYKEQVVLKAQGEVSRFEQVLPEFNKAPELTKKRIYLETMQDVMKNSTKIVVDTKSNNNVLYLPLPQTQAMPKDTNKQNTQNNSTSSYVDNSSNSTNNTYEQLPNENTVSEPLRSNPVRGTYQRGTR